MTTNSIGQTIQQKTVSGELEYDVQLNQSGMYFIEFSTQKAKFVKKVLVHNK